MAYVAGNKTAMRLAERIRAEFRRSPSTPGARRSRRRTPKRRAALRRCGSTSDPVWLRLEGLDAQAKAAFLDGEKDGSTADKYVRLTVVLASILFLVGIPTHFP